MPSEEFKHVLLSRSLAVCFGCWFRFAKAVLWEGLAGDVAGAGDPLRRAERRIDAGLGGGLSGGAGRLGGRVRRWFGYKSCPAALAQSVKGSVANRLCCSGES